MSLRDEYQACFSEETDDSEVSGLSSSTSSNSDTGPDEEDPQSVDEFTQNLARISVEQGVKEAVQQLKRINVPQYANYSLLDYLTKLNGSVSMPNLFWSALVTWSVVALIRNACLSDSKLMIRQPPPHKPFFPAHSNIFDYYQGDFGAPFDLYNRATLTVTMFYSHWSLHSKEARRHFVDLASVLKSGDIPVRLNAVNCDTGYCKRAYKIYSYPVFLATTSMNIPIFYDDIPTTNRLLSWILRILKPLRRVNRADDEAFEDSAYDLFVLAYLPVKYNVPPTHEYMVYYTAAMRNKHPRVQFTLTTDAAVAAKYGLNEPGWFKVVDRIFSITNNTNSQAILDRVKAHLDLVKNRTCVTLKSELEEAEGLRSTELHRLVSATGQAIVLLTSLLGPTRSSTNTEVFRRLAEEYNNCHNSTEQPTSSFKSTSIFDWKLAQRDCESVYDSMNCPDPPKEDVCQSRERSSKKHPKIHDMKTCGNDQFFKKGSLRNSHCSHSTSPTFHQKSNCVLKQLLKRTTPYSIDDLRSQQGPNLRLPPNLAQLRGLGCGQNRTLQFVIMDKAQGAHFIRTWNLPGPKYHTDEHEDRIGLVSLTDEVVHAANFTNNWDLIVETILSFHNETLKPTILDETNRKSQFSAWKDEPDQQHTTHSTASVINRLTANTFRSEILYNPNRSHSALVFFSAGSFNGHSMALTHVLHTVMHEFNCFESLVRFYIIDTSRNSMPLAFDFDTLPVIVFFPPKTQPHLQVTRYPAALPITAPNLIAFIVARAQPELKWRMALRDCGPDCLQRNRLALLHFDRRLRDEVRRLRMSKRKLTKASWRNKAIMATLKRRRAQRSVSHYLLNVIRLVSESLPDSAHAQDSILINYLLSHKFTTPL